MTVIISQCFNCKYYDRYDPERHSCKAFPSGIPEDILDNTIKHNKVLDNQVGDYIFEEEE